MSLFSHLGLRILLPLIVLPGIAGAADDVDFFADEVWGKVAQGTCLKCHKTGGDAEDSDFILLDPGRDSNGKNPVENNHAAFTKMAKLKEGDDSRMLLKVVGKLDHGGEDVLAPDSTRFRILEDFVRRVNGSSAPPAVARPSAPFFADVKMIDDTRLLRRLTLSLGARLPTDSEKAEVAMGGLVALGNVMDSVMREEAFYDRLAEGFNDIFLTPGIDDNAETVLSYEHFEKTRLWYQKWDFSAIEDEKERERAGWRLAAEYREAINGEPMEMVKHIVRNERPFTEIIDADYIMVTPHSARGYGVYEEVKARFKDPSNYLEYVPVKIKALKGRSESTHQESATGYYPHAGLLSTFQYLRRYPTTETNRNRLRVRMYFQHFLGIDIMQLAPRGNDAAAISAKYEVPAMEAADCVVCHKIIDPVAGLFQDYYALDGNGVYLRRKEGWFTDMFPPGFEGEALPESERWRALQWLSERTVKDPRFAVAMVEHVWYVLTGRTALRPPIDVDDPLYAAKRRAYEEQRLEIGRIAGRFAAEEKFNLKFVFKALAASPFYRADGLEVALQDPSRAAELDDAGLVRLLSPEQLNRKLKAVFGKGWNPLNEQFMILYGGIDSKEVTERIANPGGAMGAIQRMMANDTACKSVALDFSRPRAERLLFPNIEADDTSEENVRAAVAFLHERLLGHVDSLETERTYQLFADILAEAKERAPYEELDIYHCRDADDKRVKDPHYTYRAWRAVVTYLLRQHEFLYE